MSVLVKRVLYGTFEDLIKVVKRARRAQYDQVELDDLSISIETAMVAIGEPNKMGPHRISDSKGWYRDYRTLKTINATAFKLVLIKNS